MLKLRSRDTPSAEKIRDFLGIFPKGGGGLLNSQNFCKLTKIILMCQKMFYNSGEVISDQFNHITLDSKSGKFWKNRRKQEVLDFFPLRGGGGSPIPKSICHNSYQKVNTLMKTKNAPKGLKCNKPYFFLKQGFPKGGEGHLFPKVYVRIVTKKWTFWWRPKMLQRT